MQVHAFEDLAGKKLVGDIEVLDAPDGDHDAFRFLFWIDDHILGDNNPINSITAIHQDGRREPITVFRCRPLEEATPPR